MSNEISKTTVRNRWIPVIASVFIQMCLGTAYIWSVFQSYLIVSKATPNALFKWDPWYGTIAYSLLLFVLTFGSTVGGGILSKTRNPRLVIIASGIIMGIGFFLARLTTEGTPWLLWLTYGIIGGFGMGMAYTTTIATCQKWFPDKRGLVTGIVVAALGFGGFVFTFVVEKIIKSIGVLETFSVLGIIFALVAVLGSLFISNPPENYKPDGWIPPAPKEGILVQNFSSKEALGTKQFWMVTLTLMFATAAGSMMIPMAKILGLQPDSGLTKEAAVLGVYFITVCNSAGRLFWGWFSDRLGRRKTVLILLVVTFASILCVIPAKAFLMLLFIAIIGFSYGGYLGVFPALTADYFGPKNVAQIYGMVLLGFGAGAVVSSVTVAVLSKTQAFSTAFIIASIAAVIGFIIMFAMKAPKAKSEKAI